MTTSKYYKYLQDWKTRIENKNDKFIHLCGTRIEFDDIEYAYRQLLKECNGDGDGDGDIIIRFDIVLTDLFNLLNVYDLIYYIELHGDYNCEDEYNFGKCFEKFYNLEFLTINYYKFYGLSLNNVSRNLRHLDCKNHGIILDLENLTNFHSLQTLIIDRNKVHKLPKLPSFCTIITV